MPRANSLLSKISARCLLVALLIATPAVVEAFAVNTDTAEAKKPNLQNLRNKMERARSKIYRSRKKEKVLTTDLAKYTKRINNLQGDITKLQHKQVRIQTVLDLKQDRLGKTQIRLRKEKIRLSLLNTHLKEAQQILSQRMVQLYKMGDSRPNAVKVMMEAKGFTDMLERGKLLERIAEQDSQIITHVRKSRLEATESAGKLAALESQQRQMAEEVEARKSQVVGVKRSLESKQSSYQEVRGQKRRRLSNIQDDRKHAEEDLSAMERQEENITGIIRRSRDSGSDTERSYGPIREGSGSLIWPVNGSVSSGFGYRWGRLHAGIDIPAGEGTPIRAADSGTVTYAGWMGGYGNYTIISHSGSLRTCYGHQSSIGVSVGQHVKKGQVIGRVGNTGHSFGAHLHFETRDGSGTPHDPMRHL
jgi:murein DD-endopeptidase MepM/ murein hydrolase activator NlpD